MQAGSRCPSNSFCDSNVCSGGICRGGPSLRSYGGTPPSNRRPLYRCEGDCDSDEDCQPGLICYQRDGYHPVPYCFLDGTSDHDYCIPPPNGSELFTWVSFSELSSNKLTNFYL